ncbi:redoxin domain-containing protein [Chitinophaga sp.]|uniref:redoxin domain-containing protein n=1 Tax=Chitinophaga sp. TaxID=1869181 RepID=UPI002615C72F|nr:TlpA disulfide reductase family protein [uncultured Chitinophaga sp.]
MKKSLTILLFALGGSLVVHAGPGAPGKLRVSVAPGGTIETSIDVVYLTDNPSEKSTTESIRISRGTKIAPLERSLGTGSQIVTIWRVPFLVSQGETLDVTINATSLNNTGNAVVAKIKGKTDKANLPRFIDSIYRYDMAITSREAMDAWLQNNSRLLDQAMQAAGANEQDRAVLKAYESYFKLARRLPVVKHKPEMAKEATFSKWLFDGFEIASPDFSKLADNSVIPNITRFWWEGRKLAEPDLREEFLFIDLIRFAKSERLKQETAYHWVIMELKHKKFTPELKHVYPMLRTNLKPSARTKAIDSLYQAYSIMDRGKPAYNFVMKDASGKVVRLSDYKGKMVVLDFWADWCKGCIASLPDYKKMAGAYKDSSDIVFLTIAWQDEGTEDIWKELSAKHQVAGPNNMVIIRKEESKEYQRFFEAYKITGVPRYIAIDKEGNWLCNQLSYPMEAMAAQVRDLYNEQKYE